MGESNNSKKHKKEGNDTEEKDINRIEPEMILSSSLEDDTTVLREIENDNAEIPINTENDRDSLLRHPGAVLIQSSPAFIDAHKNKDYFVDENNFQVDKVYVVNENGTPVEVKDYVSDDRNEGDDNKDDEQPLYSGFGNYTYNESIEQGKIRKPDGILKTNDLVLLNIKNIRECDNSSETSNLQFPETVPESPPMLLGDPTLSMVDEFIVLEDIQRQNSLKTKGFLRRAWCILTCGVCSCR